MTNFCTGVGVHDVITCADLYDYRLRGLGVAGGGQILGFSIDFRCRPYNTQEPKNKNLTRFGGQSDLVFMSGFSPITVMLSWIVLMP